MSQSADAALSMSGISKRFPGVHALKKFRSRSDRERSSD